MTSPDLLIWDGAPRAASTRRVGPDGTTLTGARIQLLRYDAPWENPLIEAPSIARAGTTYFLF
jgi:hypothetical protein